MLFDKIAAHLPKAIEGDGIQTDNDQGKGPALPAEGIDHRDKTCEHEKDPPGAEKDPTGSPDSLDERTDSQFCNEPSQDDSNHTGDEETDEFVSHRDVTF